MSAVVICGGQIVICFGQIFITKHLLVLVAQHNGLANGLSTHGAVSD